MMKICINNKISDTSKEFLSTGVIDYEGKKKFDKEFLIKLKDFDVVIINPLLIDNYLIGLIDLIKQTVNIVIAYGNNDKINRFLLERTNIDILLDPHNEKYTKRYDFIHHFNSGINHVLAEIAHRKNIAFMFSLNFLHDNNKLKIAKNIGRINQNIKLAQKYKVPVILDLIINKKLDVVKNDNLFSLMSFFDISTVQKQESSELLLKIINKNLFKKSSVFVLKGIEVLE